jgi:hypothetical protein
VIKMVWRRLSLADLIITLATKRWIGGHTETKNGLHDASKYNSPHTGFVVETATDA